MVAPAPRTGGDTQTLTGTDPRERLEDTFQVVLHNDDWNTAEHVVRCLVKVFGHSPPLAAKIMIEAHLRGKAIAEVEGETEAKRHRDQLQSHGLVATAEKV